MSIVATPTVLVIDDEVNVVNAIKRSLKSEDFEVQTSTNPIEALTLAQKIRPAAVVCDMRMPEMDGAQVLTKLRHSQPDCARILLTGYADIKSTIAAINDGQIDRYLTKPWNDDELRNILRHHIKMANLRRERDDLAVSLAFKVDELEQLNAELDQRVEARTQELNQTNLFLEQANQELRAQYLNAVKVFSNLIEMSSPVMAGHGRRVATLARCLAIEMKLPKQESQDIYIAGLLHDIGKISLPERALATPYAQLEPGTRKAMDQHSTRGQVALMALPELNHVADYVAHHHERFDGKGYPDELAGVTIPMGARILAVAEDWDELQMGLLTDQPVDAQQAAEFLQKGSGRRYDPSIVELLPAALARFKSMPHTSEQILNSHELIPGHVLSRDLFNQDGLLLMTKGSEVNSKLVQYVRALHQRDGVTFKVYCERRKTVT